MSAVEDARIGFGQRASRSAFTYIRWTSSTGFVSLPIMNMMTLGWLRIRTACEVMDARAIAFTSSDHFHDSCQ